MGQKQTSGYLYIFEDLAFSNYVKLGMSTNPINRIKDYNHDKPYATTTINYISKPFKNIVSIERQILYELHEELEVDEIVTAFEWFNIVDLEYIKNKILFFENSFELDDSLEILSTQEIVEYGVINNNKYKSMSDYDTYLSWCDNKNIQHEDKKNFYYTINKYLSYITNFKNIVILLENNINNSIIQYISYIKYPILEDAIEILGFDRIKKEKYTIKTITDILLNNNDSLVFAKIPGIILKKHKLILDDFISNKEAKEIIKDVYNILHLDVSPKGTDLEKYLILEKCSKRVNGVLTRGYFYKGTLNQYN